MEIFIAILAGIGLSTCIIILGGVAEAAVNAISDWRTVLRNKAQTIEWEERKERIQKEMSK